MVQVHSFLQTFASPWSYVHKQILYRTSHIHVYYFLHSSVCTYVRTYVEVNWRVWMNALKCRTLGATHVQILKNAMPLIMCIYDFQLHIWCRKQCLSALEQFAVSEIPTQIFWPSLPVEYMISFSGQTDTPEVRCWLTDTHTCTQSTTVTLTAHAHWGLIMYILCM